MCRRGAHAIISARSFQYIVAASCGKTLTMIVLILYNSYTYSIYYYFVAAALLFLNERVDEGRYTLYVYVVIKNYCILQTTTTSD